MAGFTLKDFGGIAPKVFSRKLPPNMATTALNVNLDSGRLVPVKSNASTLISPNYGTISAFTKTLYKHEGLWLASDTDANFVSSPIGQDPHDRIYVTGLGTGASSQFPRMTIPSLINGASTVFYRLGLPEPADFQAPSLSPVTSTKEDTETPLSTSYIYTLVSEYGEEGPPNNPEVADIVDVYSDQTVTITFPALPTGDYNITRRRLYRTDTNGTYRQVADIPTIGTGASNTYDDSKDEIELGEEIPTSGYTAPPDNDTAYHPDGPLQGLVSLPNGILAGFTGKTVCFSEAFTPNAFPEAYQLTVKSDIVALAPMRSGVLILTKGKPTLVSGLDPASMSMTEVDSTLSCVSKRSVVEMGDVILYASPDGIAVASDTGINLITEELMDREYWQQLNPTSIHAYYWEGRYVFFYTGGTDGASGGYIFDPRGGANSLVTLDFYASAGYSDVESDTLYLVTLEGGVGIRAFQQGTGNRQITWRSKSFYVTRPINPAVAKVQCDSYEYGDGAPTDVQFKLFADGALITTVTLDSDSLFRLPSGYKANEFEVEVISDLPINEICVYESAEELNG